MNRRLWFAVLLTVVLLSIASGVFASWGNYGLFALPEFAKRLDPPDARYLWLGVVAFLGVLVMRLLRLSWIGRRVSIKVMAWRGRLPLHIARANRVPVDTVQMLLEGGSGKRGRAHMEGFSGAKPGR
jgi:hypothetical protein